jgi:hypothetical protein
MYVISLTFVKDTHDAVTCKGFPLGTPKRASASQFFLTTKNAETKF